LLALIVTHTEMSLAGPDRHFLLIGIVMKNAILMVDFASTSSAAEACHRHRRSSKRR